MRCCVTGGAGFVGSAVVRALLRSGHTVKVVDDLSTGRLDNIPEGVDFECCDAATADYHETDALVHAAAYADISRNWEDETERKRVWMRGAELTRRLLEFYGSPEARPFVLLSTCAVYGEGEVSHKSGPQHTTARSPYAASKLACEALVEAYSWGGRVTGSTARLVSCVGPNYWHGHISDFVRMAQLNRTILARDDGSQKHSYVHVDDAAEEIVRLLGLRLAYPLDVSSSELWSWRDTVAIMQETRPLEIRHADARSAWIGDTIDLSVAGTGKRSVAQGVREALVSLGWRDKA
jgi:UDP-glucose 4-epimerase